MRPRIATVIAWSWFGLLVVLGSYILLFQLGGVVAPNDVVLLVIAFVYAFVGAVLMSLRPESIIGLLLLLEGTAYSVQPEQLLATVTTAPEVSGWLAPLLLLASLWNLMYITPILLLLLLFPTGRPPGRRWRWLYRADLAFVGLTAAMMVASARWRGMGGRFVADNPLASLVPLVPETTRFDAVIAPVSLAVFIALVLLSVASLFVRYRTAGATERAQIRWLLYAGVLYATGIVVGIATGAFDSERVRVVPVLLFALGFGFIPVAIAIAILRHHVFDIDIVIRRTLQYGVLTAILGGLYFGSVLLFQTSLGPLIGGADSPPVLIVTTLVLAALFNPLRLRVQRFIDRRFYRSKVNAEQALTRFSAFARDEVDLDQLRSALFGVVGETLQPERMALWLQPGPGDRSGEGVR